MRPFDPARRFAFGPILVVLILVNLASPNLLRASARLFEGGLPVVEDVRLDSANGDFRAVPGIAGAFVPWGVVPGMAKAPGVAGASFKSSLWVTNTSTSDLLLRMTFVPAAGQSTSASPLELTVAAGRTIAYSDVLFEAFSLTGPATGTILVELAAGSASPVVAARTYNDAGGRGTFGQYIPPFPAEAPVSSPGELRLEGLAAGDRFRTNVGVVNTSPRALSAAIVLTDSNGAVIGQPIPAFVPAWSLFQVNAVDAAAGVSGAALFGARITGDSSSFGAYASKIDNRTNDPIFIPASLVPRDVQILDGVASAPGAGGVVFRSSVTVANRNAAAATVTLDYYPRGGQIPTSTATYSLPPGATRIDDDVVLSLLGLSNSAGSLAVRTDSATPVVAWARTYSDGGDAGTFGQFIPPFGGSDFLGAAGGAIAGVTENADFRTNVGLVNFGPDVVQITLEARSTAGATLGSAIYAVHPGQSRFLIQILRDLGGAGEEDATFLATGDQSGGWFFWASKIDNRSTDPTFFPPVKRE